MVEVYRITGITGTFVERPLERFSRNIILLQACMHAVLNS